MRRLFIVPLVAALAACRPSPEAVRPSPRGEFLVATDDSTFWVTSGPSGMHVDGQPVQLARYDGRFYEVYAMDDDRSFEDALLVGQLLYRRDLERGDSVLVFADTTVPRIARAYARANPDARPLASDEDGADDPATVATAEIEILDVHGPYVSFEYRADLRLPGAQSWHSTRRGVVDLRAGSAMDLRGLFGDSVGARLTAAGRRAYRSIEDSVRLDGDGRARRVARSLGSFHFDETSFTLTTIDRQPAVAFVAPGRTSSDAVIPLPLPPIRADGAPWWDEVRPTLPAIDDGNVARWHGRGYDVVARTDTSGDVTQLVLADATKHEWPLATVSSPARRIFWLDAPSVSAVQRAALARAFADASFYDENVRAVALHRSARPRPRVVRFASIVHLPPPTARLPR